MIGHDDKRVELVALKSQLPIFESVPDQPRNFGTRQKHRAAAGRIQDAIHGDECLPGGEPCRRKYAVRRKATVQAKRNEHWLADYIPMGQTSLVLIH
jgi:hypothetical protein